MPSVSARERQGIARSNVFAGGGRDIEAPSEDASMRNIWPCSSSQNNRGLVREMGNVSRAQSAERLGMLMLKGWDTLIKSPCLLPDDACSESTPRRLAEIILTNLKSLSLAFTCVPGFLLSNPLQSRLENLILPRGVGSNSAGIACAEGRV